MFTGTEKRGKSSCRLLYGIKRDLKAVPLNIDARLGLYSVSGIVVEIPQAGIVRNEARPDEELQQIARPNAQMLELSF